MQCPIGHPPGPQEFCPICGRQCTPVEPDVAAAPPPHHDEPPATSSWESVRSEELSTTPSPFDLDAPNEGAPPLPLPLPPMSAPPPPPFGSPPPPPFAPGRPVGGPPGEPSAADEDAPGGAAAKARELIAELSGQQAPPPPGPSIPSQPPVGGPYSPELPPAPPGAPAAPYLPPGPAVPSFADPGRGELPPIPSYAPTEPADLRYPTAVDLPGALPIDVQDEEEPPSPGQWSDGSTPPPPGRSRRARADVDRDVLEDGRREGGPRRLPVLLLLAAVLLGAAFLVKTQLLDSDNDNTTVTPRASASRAASAPATVPGRLSAAELAASLKDAHFKHGYDWGRTRGPAPAADREQICRAQALTERGAGYPWGAHDRAGCLVALAG